MEAEKTYPEYDPDFKGWVAPFVMAEINTKVVRRTNALLDMRYGTDFRYSEGSLMPFGQLGFPLAVMLAAGLVPLEQERVETGAGGVLHVLCWSNTRANRRMRRWRDPQGGKS